MNKRDDWQKKHTGYKGKKQGETEKNKRKVILQDKKILLRENRERKSPSRPVLNLKCRRKGQRGETRAGQTT